MLGSLLTIGGSLLGGVLGNRNTNRTRDRAVDQAQAMNSQIGGYINDFKQNNPYFGMAPQAGQRLGGLLGLNGMDMTQSLQQTPGYQFRMNEGVNALEQSAVARGGLLSGKTAKDLTRFGQNYGTNAYQGMLGNYMNILDRSNQGQMGLLNAATGNATNTAGMITNAENQAGRGYASANSGMLNGILGGVGYMLGS